jgi:hypothetical protein
LSTWLIWSLLSLSAASAAKTRGLLAPAPSTSREKGNRAGRAKLVAAVIAVTIVSEEKTFIETSKQQKNLIDY